MSPFEHGECFVLDDGGESDLDLGNYERFLDISLTSEHNITTGKMYKGVIDKERRGDYLGKTVQVVPHVTNHIIVRSRVPVPPKQRCLVDLQTAALVVGLETDGRPAPLRLLVYAVRFKADPESGSSTPKCPRE